MRVLVVGYGSMGKRHAANARDLGHKVVVSDASVEVAESAIADGLTTYLSGERIDAAIIATPAATHHEVARQLLESGYSGPLLVEKPLDVTTANADFWRSWPHPTACVGYNWRFHPGVRRWGKSVAGKHLSLSCATRVDEWPGGDYASPLLECSHEIDLLLSWGRSPNSFSALPASRAEAFWKAGDGDLVSVRWEAADAMRTFSASDHPGNVLDMPEFFPPHGPDLEASYRAELAAFLDAAEREEPVRDAATIDDGLAVVGIVEQAETMVKGATR